jgi:hypothetical protein
MSSPNTCVTVGLKPHTSNLPVASYPARKLVTIGSKDTVSTTIITMAPPSGKSYARKHSFDSLISAICMHYNTFPPSNLINVVTSEMPIDTSAALQSAHNICSAIMSAPYHTANLQPINFLTKDGHPVTITSNFASKCPEDFFTSLSTVPSTLRPLTHASIRPHTPSPSVFVYPKHHNLPQSLVTTTVLTCLARVKRGNGFHIISVFTAQTLNSEPRTWSACREKT